MRTFEQIAIAALARTMEFGAQVPATRSLFYRRISVRQQELFAIAAAVNPEYFNLDVIADLTDGGVDLRLMLGDGVYEAVTVTGLTVETLVAPATDPAVGTEITIMPESESADAFLAPRAKIRDHILAGVGSDLDTVASIRMRYAYRPDPVGEDEDGSTELMLEAPYDELLVIDAARHAVQRTLGLEPARKGEIVGILDGEEKVGLESFGSFLSGFLAGRESRFHHTQGPLRG